MDEQDKKTLKIVGGVLGCVGCLAVTAFAALVGIGYWVGSTRHGGPVVSPVGPGPAPVPTTPVFPAPPTAPMPPAVLPSTWSPYVHSLVCPNNPNLRLARFEAAYPSDYTVLPCQNQEPRPWAYVTFHLEDAAGLVEGQVTLGFARGLPTQQMLESAAAQMVAQLSAPPPRPLSTDSFAARGALLMRRDAVFAVPAPIGAFAAGSYLVRQVVVPGPAFDAEGITVTLLQHVHTTEAAALTASEPTLLRAVESIRF